MTAHRQHSGSTLITTRGRKTIIPPPPSWSRATVRNNWAHVLPQLRAERARRDIALNDETGRYTYQPRQLEPLS